MQRRGGHLVVGLLIHEADARLQQHALAVHDLPLLQKVAAQGAVGGGEAHGAVVRHVEGGARRVLPQGEKPQVIGEIVVEEVDGVPRLGVVYVVQPIAVGKRQPEALLGKHQRAFQLQVLQKTLDLRARSGNGAVAPPVIQLGFGNVTPPVDEPKRRRFGGEHLADAHGFVVIQVVVERQRGRVLVHEHVMGERHGGSPPFGAWGAATRGARRRGLGFGVAPIIRETIDLCRPMLQAQ